MDGAERRRHAAEVRRRLQGWLARSGLPGVVLTQPAHVAWATGGMNPAVDRAAPTDLLWVVVRPDRAVLLTTVVERDRIADDFDPAGAGFHLEAVAWFGPAAFADAAAGILGAPAAACATDGHPAFGVVTADALVALRLAHTPEAITALRALGADAAAALQAALAAWTPGELDRQVQARLVAGLERVGAEAVCVIVSGDERVIRYRHPLQAGIPVHRLLMGVVVARRDGLHVALTRLAVRGPTPPALAARLAAVRRVEGAVLAASRPGSTYGAALTALDRAYARAGHPGAWREHYQGGPIGYGARDFEIAPGERDRPWWQTPIATGHAVAWNPSLAGGAKVEDTFLVGADGLECLTRAPGWPREPGAEPRAAVLELT